MSSNRQKRREGREGTQARKAEAREVARKAEEVAAEARAQRKRTVTLVKQTKSKAVTRTSLKVSVTSIAPSQEYLITVVFGRDNRSGTLIAYNALEEEVYGLTPHNKEHEPEVGIKYLCKRPRLDWKPLFYIKNRPVYTVKVYPLIVKQVNEKVISLTLDDPEAVITEELLSHATFGKDVVLYIENGECKYVWIKNSAYIGKVQTVLGEAEKMEQGEISNSWQKKGGNLLKAPVYAMNPGNAAQLVAQAIQQKEEKFLSKMNQLIN